MHLLYTDEANLDPATSDWFAYAGVAVSGDVAGALSAKIDGLRVKYGYRPEDLLKFNTKERPSHISADSHRDIKRELMIEAANHNVRLFCSFILHNIAVSPEEARRNEINRVCFHFNCYLNRIKDNGLVLIDRFSDTLLSKFLRQKFGVGLVGLPYSAAYRLDRILGFHLSSIGSSHFCSLVDVIVGSLRYSLNTRHDSAHLPVINALLGQIAPLAIRGSDGKVEEISLFFSPKTIRVPRYLEEYRTLHAFLAANGLNAQMQPNGS